MRRLLFDAVEAEFGVELDPAARHALATMGDLVDAVVRRHPAPGESIDAAELREHVAAVIGEVTARVAGRGFAGHHEGAPLPAPDASDG